MTDREQTRRDAEQVTAITGTWTDVARHARYIYENADEQSSEWMLAEALLAMSHGDNQRLAGLRAELDDTRARLARVRSVWEREHQQ